MALLLAALLALHQVVANAAVVNTDVVIVGAGAAGLAAAQALNNGLYGKVHQSIVLEARARAGGRLWSVNTTYGMIDLGGAWIHGPNGNPITNITRENNITTVVTPANGTYFGGHGTLPDKDAELYGSLYNAFIAYLYQQRANQALTDNTTVEQVYEQFVSAHGSDLGLSNPQTLAGLRGQISSTIEIEYAASIANLSAKYYDQDSKLPGTDVLFPDGYVQVVNVLLKGLDVRYNQVVTHINRTTTGHVLVSTSNGTIYNASAVVVTLPLGYLKKHHADMFSPALPADKVAAISTLGMGLLNKLVLAFNKPFWDSAKTNWLYRVTNSTVWLNYFNVYNALNRPVLIALNGGDYAWQLEAKSDNATVAEALQALQTMFPDQVIPHPIEAVVTRWGSDNYTYGAYSYIAAGAAADVYQAMGKPVENTLFFAGEGTSPQFPATVHGAYLSGLREAKNVVAALENKQQPEAERRKLARALI